jgi:signal transduction histidine kinase/Tfp pilus assembly protein PilF
MNAGKLILFFFLLFNSILYAQNDNSVDSIKQAVVKEADYQRRIGLLQNHLTTIYLTQYQATIDLAGFGYLLAEKQKDSINMGDFLRFIGNAYGRLGNIDSSTTYYYKALEKLESTNNPEKLGLLYDDMARMYRKLRQPKRALEFYNKALALYEAENNLEGIARINNESGVVFRDEGNYEEANKRFTTSLEIQRKRNDSTGIGYSLEFLGYNQLLIKNYKKAEAYLKQALEFRKALNDDFALMLNYTALGEYYKEVGQPGLSNDFFRKSNAVAVKINFADIQKYNFDQITMNYEALGDYKNAFQSLKSYNQINDSLYNAKKMKDVEEISAKYETAEKENQILVQRAKLTENELRIKSRNLWIFGLSALAVILSLIGFLLYKQQVLKNLKQQQDSEIQLAIEKIESQHKLQEQRLLISRDLHDNIGAQLSFIISTIETIRYHFNDKDGSVSGQLSAISSFAKETIQELRDTVWAMNKTGISITDLHSRIMNFIERINQSPINCTVSLQVDDEVWGTGLFSGIDGLNIFRIIQEATNNALKYSGADKIAIKISSDGKRTLFFISDNGNGFVEKEVEAGNGLYNMRKRSLELGEELQLSSHPGKGTSIEFSAIVNAKNV